MSGPLAAALAAVMGLSALYCAGRLVAAPLLGRSSERGVDLLHVVMGSVMAATLLGVLGRRWDVLWVVGFAVAAFWYLREGLVRRSRHSLQHGLGSIAMLAMVTAGTSPYVAGAGRSLTQLREMPGMPGMGSGQLGALAPSSLLLALLAVGVLALTAADTAEVMQLGRRSGGSGAAVRVGAGAVRSLAPRCATGCRVAMGLAMGIALIAMV